MMGKRVVKEVGERILGGGMLTIPISVLGIWICAFGPKQSIAIELVCAGGKCQRIFAKIHAAKLIGRIIGSILSILWQ
jgi:hypothetical protein